MERNRHLKLHNPAKIPENDLGSRQNASAPLNSRQTRTNSKVSKDNKHLARRDLPKPTIPEPDYPKDREKMADPGDPAIPCRDESPNNGKWSR